MQSAAHRMNSGVMLKSLVTLKQPAGVLVDDSVRVIIRR